MKTLYKITMLCALLFSASVVFAQQTERENGIELYNKGDYENAVKTLKTAVKDNSSDAQAWYYLGLAFLKNDRKKEAEKALEKAVTLASSDAAINTSLAYVYLLRNNLAGAQQKAQTALAIDPKIAEAHYVLGYVSALSGSYNVAYERAKKAIELNSDFAPAYLLKSESLVSSFSIQSGTVLNPLNARNKLLNEATADLEKFLTLSPDNPEKEFQREYLGSLKYFAEYYSRPENQKPVNFDTVVQTDKSKTPVNIIYKPRVQYSSKAREVGVMGTIRLLVDFAASGKVEHILIVKPLGYGLDEGAAKAARSIKFEPATKDGKAYSVVKMVEYTFTIY